MLPCKRIWLLIGMPPDQPALYKIYCVPDLNLNICFAYFYRFGAKFNSNCCLVVMFELAFHKVKG
jgi:hypothetical protein